MKPTTTEPPRSAGRPRAFDRAHALSLAMELFWQQGFAATSTAQLTQAMGIAPPSLYAAFGSKEALYREALALYQAQYGQFLQTPFAQAGSVRDAMAAMLAAAAQQFSQRSHPLGCMVACGELQASPGNSPLAGELTHLRQAAQHSLWQQLETARQRGGLPEPTDTKTLAAFYALVVQGMAIQARDGTPLAELNLLAQQAMQAWPRED